MIRNEKFLILASDSTHFIIFLEELLKRNNISSRIIPLPTEISANCGLSLKVDLNFEKEIKELIRKENLKINLYFVEKQGLKKQIKKI